MFQRLGNRWSRTTAQICARCVASVYYVRHLDRMNESSQIGPKRQRRFEQLVNMRRPWNDSIISCELRSGGGPWKSETPKLRPSKAHSLLLLEVVGEQAHEEQGGASQPSFWGPSRCHARPASASAIVTQASRQQHQATLDGSI